MTTTTRQKAALTLLAAISLTGCSAEVVAVNEVEPTAEPAETSAPTADTTAEAVASTYADGTYSSSGSYQSPHGTESVDVTITLADDIITAVTVVGHGDNPESLEYQSDFAGGIAAVVVGQDIDSISVSRVAGSSLTSGGFNEAVAAIKAEAA